MFVEMRTAVLLGILMTVSLLFSCYKKFILWMEWLIFYFLFCCVAKLFAMDSKVADAFTILKMSTYNGAKVLFSIASSNRLIFIVVIRYFIGFGTRQRDWIFGSGKTSRFHCCQFGISWNSSCLQSDFSSRLLYRQKQVFKMFQ
jgi:hypothetical protein